MSFTLGHVVAPLSGSRRAIAPHRHNPAEAGRRWRGKRSLEPLGSAALLLPLTLSLRTKSSGKCAILLADFSAARSSLDHAKHGQLRRSPKPRPHSLHVEVRIRATSVTGFELRPGETLSAVTRLDQADRGGYGPALAEKIISLGVGERLRQSGKTELRRLLKEMNFPSAHRSSSPIWPATQYVSAMCRNVG